MELSTVHIENLQNRLQILLKTTRTMPCLLDVAGQTGHELYLVGGFLRDTLKGESCCDVDLATVAPEELAALCSGRVPLRTAFIDRNFGTIRFIPLERDDTGQAIRYDLSCLRGSAIDQDLSSRDFTMNALAVDLLAWRTSGELQLIDPLGGLDDLQSGLLRACSPLSFEEDPLRVLRAFRLMASYGFKLEARTRAWLLKSLPHLGRVAMERIRDELTLILSTPHSARIFLMLDQDSILDLLLPECRPMRGLSQNQFHNLDVWKHSLSALESLEMLLDNPDELLQDHAADALAVLGQKLAANRTRLLMLKLAVLIHDIGKPSCWTVDDHGNVHFYGHEIAGERLAYALCSRLLLSRRETDFVSLLVRQHMRAVHLFGLKQPSLRALSRFFRLGPPVFWSLLLLFAADYLASSGPRSAGGDMVLLHRQLQSWLDHYHRSLKPREKEPPLVRGDDLIDYLHIGPGPIVGKLMRVLAELQWEGRISTREEALGEASRRLTEWLKEGRRT
jgi:poly(A) polymerase